MTACHLKLSTVLAMLTFVLPVIAGCGDGPGIIDRHDYSAFYDFGGFGDIVEPADGGTDVSVRDTTNVDDAKRDTATPDASAHDTSTDTTFSGTTVTFVTDKAWEIRANAMIAGAKSSVDVVHLEFLTYSPEDISIATSLKSAAGRGVPIRVLLDDGVDSNPGRVDELDAVPNIQAKLDNWPGTTHVKMIIVDDNQVLVGSTNLSKSSLHFNHEANLYITDRDAVPEYMDYFDALWARPDTKKKMGATITGAGILPIGDGEYVGAVTPWIQSASTRIWLVMYDLNQDSGSARDLTDLLLDAEGRGVEVRAFFERCNESHASYVTYDNEESADVLEDGGTEVRFDEPVADEDELITHAKLLIIDDAVVVYSGNWNNSGLNNNHEAGAVVDGVDTVTTTAESYFNTLWNTGVAWP